MITRIDHIGIAVNNIEETLKVYRDALSLEVTHVADEPEQRVKVAFLPRGDTEIELLEPYPGDGPIRKFMEKRGEGIHHLCLEVDDIEAALAQLAAQGVPLIDTSPRTNSRGHKIAFIHPKGAHGVLIELYQY
ncbi:MAG: methylmalonyl-CoA epimerase [Chloroflexi bacterium]|nr:methylmalonyl-CoA epimerase [Chloroflexota bacterium]